MRRRIAAFLAAFVLLHASLLAQTIQPERVTFNDAIQRAASRNPTVQAAAADILRADALLRQVRARTLPSITANAVTTTLDDARGFAGNEFAPRSVLSANLSVGMLLFAPARWAQRTQTEDLVKVAHVSGAEVGRQIALATAQAYLAVIAQRKVVDVRTRARDTAKAHFDLAHQRQVGGVGSRLNELRAQQELSSDEALVEDALFGVRRAQEALGVLIAADGPADAQDEPAFDVPAEGAVATETAIRERTDVRLFSTRVDAARRVVSDSWKDRLPSVAGLFEPLYQHPGTFFQPSRSWRAQLLFSVPVLDAGERAGRRAERDALLSQSQVALAGALRQATSDVRTAYEAVRSADRALASTRAAAQQAAEVVTIVNVSYRAGATTNIEVIDAQRRARDAETAAAVAEDTARRARLDLVTALGRFP